LDPNQNSASNLERSVALPVTRRAARLVVALCLAAGAVSVASAANWEVSAAPRGGQKTCLLVSAKQPVNDGYQEVQAQIIVDGSAVVINSDSVLDPGFADIGLAVAKHPFIPADEVRARKQAVFEKQYAKIVQLFKDGREVRVQMRFWPTWPATGTHSVSFSLMGFTKAYDEAAKCE
jgi:hypothetical protein